MCTLIDAYVDKKAGTISTKSNRSKPRAKKIEKKKLVIAFDIADSAELPMHGLINADIKLLLPDAEKEILPTFFVNRGLSTVTVEMDIQSGARGQLHVEFLSAKNPYKPAFASDDIDESFPYKGNETFTIPNDNGPLVFKIAPASKEYTIISTSKQGAIQAISSSEKVTKGGKVYAEAEGGLPFITKVKGGVEVSGSLEDTNTIVDSTMQEGETANWRACG